jgi:hypothetical protein
VAMAALSTATRAAQPAGHRRDRGDTATRTTDEKTTGTPARLSQTVRTRAVSVVADITS